MAETHSSFDDEDDFELELEPVDPEVLAHEKRRAEEKIDEIVKRVDVDEVIRSTGPHSDIGADFDFSDWKNFRFTTRHLLMLTAILAVMFTIFRVGVSCNTVFWVAVAALAGGWYWVYRAERRREAERQRQRAILLKSFGRADEVPEEANEAALSQPRGFKFTFSLRQLFITMTVAAVAVWLLQIINPQILSVLLGLIAIGGIVATVAGFEAPPIVVLGWWLLLVVYIVVAIIAQLHG